MHRITEYSFYLFILSSFMIDKTTIDFFSKYITIPHLFHVIFIVIAWSKLFFEKKLVSSCKSLLEDKILLNLVLLPFTLFILYQLAVLYPAYRDFHTFNPRYQVSWISIYLLFITTFLLLKTGFFTEILLRNSILFLVLGQTVNVLLALVQIKYYLADNRFLSFYFASGSMAPGPFGVYMAMFLPVLLGLSRKMCFYRIPVILLFFLSSAIIPFSGKRSATICYFSFILTAVILMGFRNTWRMIAISFLGFTISTVFILFKGFPVRSMIIDNPSTHSRSYLLKLDTSLTLKRKWTGYGNEINYWNKIVREKLYSDFEKIDPFHKGVPGGGAAQIAVIAGIPSLVFYVLFMLGISVLFFAGIFFSNSSFWIKSFLVSFIAFSSGFVLIALYGIFPWVLILLGTVFSLKSLENKRVSVKIILKKIPKYIFFESATSFLNFIWNVRKKLLKKSDKKDPEKIIVLGLIGLGDWCVVLPFLSGLRDKYPGSKIKIITNGIGRKILLTTGSKEEDIITLPGFAPGIGKFISIAKWALNKGNDLKSDLIVSLWWNLPHQLLACLIQGKHYHGFFSCYGDSVYKTFTRKYPLSSSLALHEVWHSETEWFGGHALKLCEGIGIKYSPDSIRWTLPPESGLLSSAAGKNIVCQPNSPMPNRNWSAARWVEALTEISKHVEIKVVLTGSPEDENVCLDFMEKAGGKFDVVNMCSGPIGELFHLLKKCDLFMGTDSGPGHMAGLVGAQSVLLYGPNRPENYKPVNFKGIQLYAGASCSPCGFVECPLVSSENRKCMNEINVESVVKAALELLKD